MTQPRKTCPGCGADMALVAAVRPADAFAAPEQWETQGEWWQCFECGCQDDIGQDVEAQLEGRPRLL